MFSLQSGLAGKGSVVLRGFIVWVDGTGVCVYCASSVGFSVILVVRCDDLCVSVAVHTWALSRVLRSHTPSPLFFLFFYWRSLFFLRQNITFFLPAASSSKRLYTQFNTQTT